METPAALAALDAAGRVALIHDWLTGMRGGEKCLEVLCEIFPHADLYTLLHVPGSVSPRLEERRIVTSFVQQLPGARRHYRRWLPLFPRAIESFDLAAYDLVISSSHCVAKGVRPARGALHIDYCHTPMRYMWDQFEAYFGPGRAGPATRLAARLWRDPLRRWDVRTSVRVHQFVANSEHVRQRIRRYYDRDATVIHPPVDVGRFAAAATAPAASNADGYFLIVGAFAPYKRIDVAIEAVRAAGVRLRVVGSGPEAARLQAQARGAAIEFVPWVSDDALARLYAGCHALLFPGEEDFGIAPLECMAAGRPVIALGRGGALETIVPGRTGILVPTQDPAAWAAALRGFDAAAFEPRVLRAHAAQFDRELYRERMTRLITEAWAAHARGR